MRFINEKFSINSWKYLKGLSSSLAKIFYSNNTKLVYFININKIRHLSSEINASLFQFDVSKSEMLLGYLKKLKKV